MPRKKKSDTKSEEKEIDKSESKDIEPKDDKKLEVELKKLGSTKVFVESEDSPDYYKEHPLIVVCKNNPRDYIYPMMIKLETSNIVRLTAMNNYVSTVLRLADLFKWCMDIRIKRKRQMKHIESGKILIVNEFVLEKIPACRS